MKKRIASVIAVTGIALSLAACSSTSQSKHQVLQVWDMQQSGKSITAAYAPIIKEFEAANPGTTVKLTVFPYEQYQSKALLAMKGGTGPDVLSLDQIWTPQFAAAGLISPLDKDLASDKSISAKDFFAGAWASNVYQGKTWGVPLNADVWEELYYNEDLFKAAGITAPPTTWTQWNADAAKLTNTANGQFGISLIGCKNEGSVVVSDSLSFSNGGTVVTNGKASFNSPANVAALQEYSDLSKFAPPGVAGTCEQDAVSRFTAGKAAMLLDGSWQQDTMKTAAKFDWKIAVPPAPEGKKFVGALGGFNLAINAKSTEQSTAFKWIKFISTAKNETAVNSLIPALNAAGTSFVEANRQQPEIVLQALKDGSPRPLTPIYPEISDAQQAGVQSILGGESVSAAVASTNTAIEAAIQSAK